MRYTKTVGYILLAVLLVSTLPCAAEAASVKIQPHQFKPVDPSDPYNYQEPAYIWGDGGPAHYYAVVNLPVGRTITALLLYHRGGGGLISRARLWRTRFRQPSEYVAGISTTVNTGEHVVGVATGTIERPLVKADFTYHVEVGLESGNYIHGVRIYYE